jgi:N-acetylglutamate synthase-like GNAT family acetyltransferase
MRPLDLRQDLDELTTLLAACFSGDLTSRGRRFREQLISARQTVSLLSLLGRFSDTFRHQSGGFVWQEQGRAVAMVTVHREGPDKTRWTIGSLATHPDYRRRRLARRLMIRALEHAREHGAELCTFFVLARNAPAHNLCRSLGFRHYDTTIELKLEQPPDLQARPAEGYRYRLLNICEWQARYDLALRETPPAVQAFLPVSQAKYRLSAVERLLMRFALRLQHIESHHWAAEHEGQVVGCLHLHARRGPTTTHDLRLVLDPAHSAVLARPLLNLALTIQREYAEGSTQITVRPASTDLLALLKEYGFVGIEAQHWLGVRLR